MLSHKVDFNCCANRDGFHKSSHISLFYSELLLKSLHYAQFYSFYATDYIMILATIKLLTPFLLYS